MLCFKYKLYTLNILLKFIITLRGEVIYFLVAIVPPSLINAYNQYFHLLLDGRYCTVHYFACTLNMVHCTHLINVKLDSHLASLEIRVYGQTHNIHAYYRKTPAPHTSNLMEIPQKYHCSVINTPICEPHLTQQVRKVIAWLTFTGLICGESQRAR